MKIIFDFDGTLVDSMPKLRDLATRIIADGYNIHIDQADKQYMATIGRTFHEQLEWMYPDSPLNERLASEFYDRQEEAYKNVRLHAGVIETIEFLNTTPFTYGVCSSTDDAIAYGVIKRLLPEFSGVITGRRFGSKFSQLRAHFGYTDKDKRWFIGDAPFDAETARNAGGNFVGVTHTFDIWVSSGRTEPFYLMNSIPEAVEEVLRGVSEPVQLHLSDTKGKYGGVPLRVVQHITGGF